MSLADIIAGKLKFSDAATAIPATPATNPPSAPASVAGVATVAVANAKNVRPEAFGERAMPAPQVGDTATHADMLELHPDAGPAEPFTPTIRKPSAPLTAGPAARTRKSRKAGGSPSAKSAKSPFCHFWHCPTPPYFGPDCDRAGILPPATF